MIEVNKAKEMNIFTIWKRICITGLFVLVILTVTIPEFGFSQVTDDRKEIAIGTDLRNYPDLYNYVVTRHPNVIDSTSGNLLYKIEVNSTINQVLFGNETEPLTPELTALFARYPNLLKDKTVEVEQSKEQDKYTLLSPVTGSKNSNPWSNNKLFEISKNPFTVWNLFDRYVNPYFQAFGGYPLGIPFKYGTGLGLTLGLGTPYSGPMETDFVKLGLHLAMLEVSVTSRIKELVYKYSSNQKIEVEKSSLIGNWNNLYAPHFGAEIGADILPFLRVSYFYTLDTLSGEVDPPVIVRNAKTGSPMKNNVVREKGYFGAELFIRNVQVLRSSYFNIYAARYLGEFQLGFVGREMVIHNFNFDSRLNFTLAGKREFQVLFELYFNELFEGFGNRAVGLGPSIRLGKTPVENFGVITFLLNMRIKVGDYFDYRLY